MSSGRLLWQLKTRELDVTDGALMGVVNVTPDSFSDGGSHLLPDVAIQHGRELADAGAQIIDVGGESSRPGAEPVAVHEELKRVLPVVRELAAAGLTVSIDTTKPRVAEAALDAGAEIVNDVSGAASPGMIDVVSSADAGLVLMHSRGAPRSMQDDPRYVDVLSEVVEHLHDRARVAVAQGVDPGAIVVDPGIGFGKTLVHNLELLNGLEQLVALGYPVLVGTSRKSFLGTLTGIESAADRDGATAITTALGFERGARIFRVHDVASSRVALSIVAAIVTPQRWEEWLQV